MSRPPIAQPCSLISSPVMKVRCAEMISRVAETNSLERVRRRATANALAATSPRSTPTRTMTRKTTTPRATVEAPWNPVLTTPSTTKNRATAVPSLNSDSPSKMIVSRRGAPKSLNSASTATGSVAEMIAPNSSRIENGTGTPDQQQEQVEQPRGPEGGDQQATHGQQRDRPGVVEHGADAHGVARLEDQHGQEDQEEQLGCELELLEEPEDRREPRQPDDRHEHEADRHEQDRVGQLEPPGGVEHHRRERQQDEDREDCRDRQLHASSWQRRAAGVGDPEQDVGRSGR